MAEQTRESGEGIRILLAVKMDIKFEAISIELQQSQIHRKLEGFFKNIDLCFCHFFNMDETKKIFFQKVLVYRFLKRKDHF